jgi:hypothetical protein
MARERNEFHAMLRKASVDAEFFMKDYPE